MSDAGVSIFLVDDDPFQLQFLGGVLRASGHVVEAFGQPEALLLRLTPRDRGCVVLDLRMPGLNGLELQRALIERGAFLPMIFVSGQADVPAAVAAMKHGALDFLAKPVDPRELCATVARALRRDAETAADRAVRAEAKERWAALSGREQEVCRLFARGLLNKQIAAELHVTESTAQALRARGLSKLRATTVADVGRLMSQAGDG
jgi:FixJ family two-component response regulator